MEQLPIFINIKDHRCLVVGAGPIGISKALTLANAGAIVDLVAPEIALDQLDELADIPNIRFHQQRFEKKHLQVDDTMLVVAATDNEVLNRHIVSLAKQQRVLANAVTDRACSNFIMPAIIDRSPVVIAVSTSGASPMLARLMRTRLETWIPHAFGRLAAITSEFRKAVKTRFATLQERRVFWQATLTGTAAELVFAGREQDARKRIQEALNKGENNATGEVYLVGAGPGDPDLLTFRAMRLMQQADVVVYDRLVSTTALDLVRRDAQRIYVGKRRTQHTLQQADINSLLVQLAREGKRVLRLKGGDPFIFGRGGEEIQALAKEQIPFQVVPGITAASGCAAYAGIPLTHRDHAHACVFITGNMKDGQNLNFDQLTLPYQTVVLYMSLAMLPSICHELMAHGMTADMPIALIQNGTTSQQTVLIATVATLNTILEQYQLQSPTLVIIGTVVTLREELRWFETTTADC